MLNQRWRLAVVATLLTPPLLWLGWSGPTVNTPAPSGGAEENVDFFIEQARITRWQEDGSEAHQINTELMQHLPELSLTRLHNPEVNVPGQGEATPYRLRADTGEVPDSHEQVELAGGVLLHDNSQSEATVKLSTEQLTLYPAEERAHTAQIVRVERGDDTTEALGMDVYFEEQRIELLSDVKGVYHAQ